MKLIKFLLISWFTIISLSVGFVLCVFIALFFIPGQIAFDLSKDFYKWVILTLAKK